jgi:hypothetical protein
MLLHSGFEKPTLEIMAAWQAWFASIADRTVVHGGRRSGREIAHGGTRDLPLGPDSITAYSIITAESLENAETVARGNPFVASLGIYEIAAA